MSLDHRSKAPRESTARRIFQADIDALMTFTDEVAHECTFLMMTWRLEDPRKGTPPKLLR